MHALRLLLLFCIIASTQQLNGQKNVSNYVITLDRDTIVADEIFYTNVGKSDLKFTLTLSDGTEKIILGEKVWRVKETRKGKVRSYQVAKFADENRMIYKLLQLAVSGKLSLMYDKRSGANWSFVTGLGFNDFVTRFQNFEKLKNLLNECKAFRETYATSKSQRFKNLEEMILFYNQHCDGVTAQGVELGNKIFKGCVSLHLNQQSLIIKNQQELEGVVRKDASRDRCLRGLPQINWDEYLLVGNSISSGSCFRPVGLASTYTYNKESNTIDLDIEYAKDQPLCRALSKYNYWLLLPKPNDSVAVVTSYRIIDSP